MKPIRVLLVEDNEGDIILTREAFEHGRFDYDFDVVRNGMDAMEYLNRESSSPEGRLPDLVILDINLPRMNGQEVLSAIKRNDKLRQLPVVMFTTSSTDVDIIESYRNFANCYVTKPFGTHDFEEAVHSIEDFWMNLVQLPKKGR